MRKIYKKLTKDQKSRGIIFTSTLSKYPSETMLDLTHEVKKTDDDIEATIARLKNDSFFDNSPVYKFNIIRS